MRTIAGTFETQSEAEAAGRRLEAIGVAREAIKLRDGVGPGTGAAVLTAKVSSEQLKAATDILAGRAASSDGPAPVSEASSGHVYFGGPADGAPRSPRPAPTAPTQTAVGGDPDDQARWWRKFLLLTGIALILAFIVGALLGRVMP
jgi:hypothetical protein